MSCQQGAEIPGVQLVPIVPIKQGKFVGLLRLGLQLVYNEQGAELLPLGIGTGMVQVGLNAPGEEPTVILPGFHHDGKIGQLGCPTVNVQAVEILLDNGGGGIPLAPPLTLIDLHEHIKGIDQNMAAAHAGVNEGDVLGPKSLPLGAQHHQLSFHLRLLFRLIQIVLPVFTQGRVRVALQPQPSQGVFHHVAHDPVGGKELGGGGDALLGDLHILFQQIKGLGFQLGVVILIQPPDDLHLVGPVLLGNVGYHAAKDAVRAENVIGKEQLGIAAHLLKHLGQAFTQGIALGEQQVPVESLGLILLDVLRHLALIQSGQVNVEGLLQNLRVKGPLGVGEHPDVAGQVVVDLHIPQGDEAVEPGVGHLLHHLFIALGLDLPHQLPALALLLGGQGHAVDGDGVFLSIAVLGDTVLIGPLGHLLHERGTGPDGKFLDGGFVHPGFLL